MKSKFEEYLYIQGFADTRTPRISAALEQLHGAICYLDTFNLALLKKYYPEAIPLARKYAKHYPVDNQLTCKHYD